MKAFGLGIAVGLALVILLAVLARSAPAADLALPCGYFNQSGGFYGGRTGGPDCLRFAAAGGCTIPLNWQTASDFAFPREPASAAGLSWYAGQPPHGGSASPSHGGHCPCQPQHEEIAPGLPRLAP